MKYTDHEAALRMKFLPESNFSKERRADKLRSPNEIRAINKSSSSLYITNFNHPPLQLLYYLWRSRGRHYLKLNEAFKASLRKFLQSHLEPTGPYYVDGIKTQPCEIHDGLRAVVDFKIFLRPCKLVIVTRAREIFY